MTYASHAMVCLCLISFQTAVVPFLLPDVGLCDLLIPFVLYMGIHRPAREGLLVIVLLGFVTDNLSAGPFGMYQVAYVWTFVGTKWLVTFLHLRRNRLLLPLVTAAAVLLENAVLLGTFALSEPELGAPADAIRVVGGQVIWGMGVGLPLVALIARGRERWDRWFRERFAKEDGARE